MKKYTKIYALIVSALFFLDRFSKTYMHINPKKVFTIFPFLQFQLAYNRGISWGMFSSSSNIIFWGLTSVIISVIVIFSFYAYTRWKENYIILPELFIIVGAISNVVDRFLYGGVVDFIVLHYKSWSWPIFNIADVAIVGGVITILVLDIYKK